MDAFPAGGASIFERSTRIKLVVHPTKAKAMALKQRLRIINCLTFGRSKGVTVFTAASYSGKVGDSIGLRAKRHADIAEQQKELVASVAGWNGAESGLGCDLLQDSAF